MSRCLRQCFALAAAVLCVVLSGCGTEAIVVSEVAMTDRPEARVVGWTADEAPRLVFSPEDEEVTLRALFEFNYRGVYEWYKVEWIAPDGSPYKVVSLRTDFGSHRDITASLKIRGKMASRLPGVWRARLWLLGREGAPDRLLVSRLFRIEEPTEALLRTGLTPVDAPAHDAPRPLVQVRGGTPSPPPATALPAAASATAATSSSGSALASAGGPAPAADFPVLPPLAVVLPDARSPAPVATGSGVRSVSLSSTPAIGRPPPPPSATHRYPGCPPMYYPPGPGCVEEAPEE